MMEDEEVVDAGKYDDLVAVIANCCYVIASIQDIDLSLYQQAGDDVVKLMAHSMKLIKKAQETILKDIQSTGINT
jgi:membrane protease subunit (stomatin/prohibitin family)